MKRLSKPLFRPEATQALQTGMSEALADPKLRSSALLTILLLASVVVFLSMFFVKVALGVTGHGVISTQRGSIPVVAERSGLITEVLSQRDAVTVKKGDVVARIRNLDLVTLRQAPSIEFSVAELEQRRQRLLKREERILTSLEIGREESSAMEIQLSLLSGQTAELQAIYSDEVRRYEGELQSKSKLLADGLIRKDKVESVQDRLADRRLQLKEGSIRLAEIDRQLSQLRLDRIDMEEGFESQLLSVQESLSDITRALKAETELDVVDIVAPEAGTLVPRGYSEGQMVAAGDMLFHISSDGDDLLFEADISASQIGELEPGMAAKISVTAYPYFEYGFIDGHVSLFTGLPNQQITLSDDLPTDSKFRVVIEPDQISFTRYLVAKELLPGMSVVVHIRKEKVAVWRILLAPLLRFQSRASI